MKIINTYFNQLIFKNNLIHKKINCFETNFLTNNKKLKKQYQFLTKNKIIDYFLDFKDNTIILSKIKNFNNFNFHKLDKFQQKKVLKNISKIIKNYQKIKKNQINKNIFNNWKDTFIFKNILFDQNWLKEIKNEFITIKKYLSTKRKNVLSHCDLHINNFLINQKNELKIIDFDTTFWNYWLFDVASVIEEIKLNFWQIDYFCRLFLIKKKTTIKVYVLYHCLFWFLWSYYYFKKSNNLMFFDLCLYHLQNYFYFKLIFSFSTVKSSTRKH